MLTPAELNRYNRQLILPEIGLAGQEKLKQAKVLVVGAGGLGCPALQYLAAAGVGTIGIADFDLVSESNLHRQILYSQSDIGRPKAEVAAQKLRQQNPFISVVAHPEGLTVQNALEIIAAYDLVLDGSDNFPTRYLVNDACAILQKPLVFGSVLQFEGQVTVFHFQGGPSYRCLFPEPPARDEIPTCSEAGVLGVLPGLIGTMQATEALKIIVGFGEVLSGKLAIFSALNYTLHTFEFSRTAQTEVQDLQSAYDFSCETPADPIPEISASELRNFLKTNPEAHLLDVREPAEYAVHNLNGLNVPLSVLETNGQLVPAGKTFVVHCKSGKRSLQAIGILKKQFPEAEFYNLTGGLDACLEIAATL